MHDSFIPERSPVLRSWQFRTSLLLTLCWFSAACDPFRKSKCEWYLVPYPKANAVMEEGWVSLCVANFKLGRQRCYFTAKPDFVEKVNGIPFRYDSLRYTDTFPKKIQSLQTCTPEDSDGR